MAGSDDREDGADGGPLSLRRLRPDATSGRDVGGEGVAGATWILVDNTAETSTATPLINTSVNIISIIDSIHSSINISKSNSSLPALPQSETALCGINIFGLVLGTALALYVTYFVWKVWRSRYQWRLTCGWDCDEHVRYPMARALTWRQKSSALAHACWWASTCQWCTIERRQHDFDPFNVSTELQQTQSTSRNRSLLDRLADHLNGSRWSEASHLHHSQQPLANLSHPTVSGTTHLGHCEHSQAIHSHQHQSTQPPPDGDSNSSRSVVSRVVIDLNQSRLTDAVKAATQDNSLVNRRKNPHHSSLLDSDQYSEDSCFLEQGFSTGLTARRQVMAQALGDRDVHDDTKCLLNSSKDRQCVAHIDTDMSVNQTDHLPRLSDSPAQTCTEGKASSCDTALRFDNAREHNWAHSSKIEMRSMDTESLVRSIDLSSESECSRSYETDWCSRGVTLNRTYVCVRTPSSVYDSDPATSLLSTSHVHESDLRAPSAAVCSVVGTSPLEKCDNSLPPFKDNVSADDAKSFCNSLIPFDTASQASEIVKRLHEGCSKTSAASNNTGHDVQRLEESRETDSTEATTCGQRFGKDEKSGSVKGEGGNTSCSINVSDTFDPSRYLNSLDRIREYDSSQTSDYYASFCDTSVAVSDTSTQWDAGHAGQSSTSVLNSQHGVGMSLLPHSQAQSLSSDLQGSLIIHATVSGDSEEEGTRALKDRHPDRELSVLPCSDNHSFMDQCSRGTPTTNYDLTYEETQGLDASNGLHDRTFAVLDESQQSSLAEDTLEDIPPERDSNSISENVTADTARATHAGRCRNGINQPSCNDTVCTPIVHRPVVDGQRAAHQSQDPLAREPSSDGCLAQDQTLSPAAMTEGTAPDIEGHCVRKDGTLVKGSDDGGSLPDSQLFPTTVHQAGHHGQVSGHLVQTRVDNADCSRTGRYVSNVTVTHFSQVTVSVFTQSGSQLPEQTEPSNRGTSLADVCTMQVSAHDCSSDDTITN